MKKIASFMIIFVLLLSLVSCGGDEGEGSDSGHTEHYLYGLSYKLPDDFTQKTAQNADAQYSNGEATFFFNAFGETEMLQDLMIESDMTVKQYTEYFLTLNPYADDYEYDAERNVSTFNYIYDYGDVGFESEYYTFLITRSEDCLYVAAAYCTVNNIEKYSQTFSEIFNSIVIE